MMEIQLRTDGLIAILTPLTDSINASISTAFKGQVMDIIYQKHDLIILNLSEIDFIDSSGLGALISILKTITKNNGKILLSNVKSSVMSLFTLTRMNLVFEIYNEEKEAIESLNHTTTPHTMQPQ